MADVQTETLQYLGVEIKKTSMSGQAVFTVKREEGKHPYSFSSLKAVQEFIDGWQTVQHLYPNRVHRLMRWPNAARRAAEDIILEVDALTGQIESAAQKNELTAGLLLAIVNRLHYIKGILNSVL